METNGSSTNYNNGINQPQLFAASSTACGNSGCSASPNSAAGRPGRRGFVQQNVDLNNNIVEPQVQQHIEQQAVADIQQQMVAMNNINAEFASMMEEQRALRRCVAARTVCSLDTAVAFQ